MNQTIDGIDPRPAANNFSYDFAGRLVDAWTPGRRQTYGFGTASCGSPAAGRNTNRTAATDTTGPTASYCYDVADRLTQVTGDTRYTGTIAYDDHGNTTTLGGTTLGYDNADRHQRTTTGSTTIDYLRDAADRITRRNLNGAVVAKYAHCGTGDNPCATLDNAGTVLERIIGLPGGATLTKKAAGDAWAFPNVHGDTVALTNATGGKQGATRTYDPFGQTTGGGTPDTLTDNLDYGWLGQHQRPIETETGLQTIEMGARQYIPGLGRFIEVDPIEGGSCNAYDYACSEPNTQFDLDGRHVITLPGGYRTTYDSGWSRWYFVNKLPSYGRLKPCASISIFGQFGVSRCYFGGQRRLRSQIRDYGRGFKLMLFRAESRAIIEDCATFIFTICGYRRGPTLCFATVFLIWPNGRVEALTSGSFNSWNKARKR